MKVIVLCLILVLAKATWAQSPPQAVPQPAAPEPQGYADCSNTKYNHAYNENTVKFVREKDGRYLGKSSRTLKKDFPLVIKGWVSEKDCKAILIKGESPLEIDGLKDKTLIVKSKVKLKLSRIYFVSQVLPNPLFRTTYLAVHVSNLSDERKRKSTLTGLILGTQIYANSLFRLNVELQSDSWKDKLTSATTSIFFAGFTSCTQIDSLSGSFAKIDLCAKLLAGKSSDPNLHVKYSFAPQLNVDVSKNWRLYSQVGLLSVISRSEGFSENAFGMDIEAGLAYRF